MKKKKSFFHDATKILYNFAGEVELAPAARLLLEERARVCVRERVSEREFSRFFTLPYELVKTPTHQTPKLLLPY